MPNGANKCCESFGFVYIIFDREQAIALASGISLNREELYIKV
ncbi:hypothetical protein [Coleofasciculus sp. FACHB-1120]|nr:hypothetical protein [Coleofasciculus sp. FACHB-1120]